MVRILPVAVLLILASPLYGQSSTPLPVSYICVEVETGMILMEENADVQRPPASMLKMMQILLVEEGVRVGRWRYDQEISVSKLAQSMGGTQVFLKAGESWPLEKLMMAITVLSANDASVAVAEGLWGSVEACLEAMNARALELGMDNTYFYSVNGLPPSDGVSFDRTTAREMAILGRALLAYPNLLSWTSMQEYALRPNDAPKANTNRLLTQLPGCDGLKTGYIRAAGFCLTATAEQNGIRLIAVVMGSDRDGRFSHTKSILEQGFTMVQRVQPVQSGMLLGKPIPVEKSMDEHIRLLARDSISALVRTADLENLSLEITAPVALEAPLEAATEMGIVRLMLGEQELGRSPLMIDRSVERARLTDYGVGCMGRRE